MGVLPQSHLSEVSFVPACNVLEKWNALCDCCVQLMREGWKKYPWLSVAHVAWEKARYPWWDLTAWRFPKHIYKSLKLEVLLTQEETADSKLTLRKIIKSPVSSIFAFALLLKGCSLSVLWVLSCLSSDFAYTLFLGNYSFQSWPQGRQLERHIISSILSFTKFLSLGSCFWAKKNCDGDCRD